MPGPPPKPVNKRARRNKDMVTQTVVEAVPSGQPALIETVPWPDKTVEWWRALGELPQTRDLNAVQWDHLMMVALIHADIWGNGNFQAISDYQKAMAEYPILPASMLRLRVTALTGDEMANKSRTQEPKQVRSAKTAYGQLKAV